MIVGFSGTQRGMSLRQQMQCADVLQWFLLVSRAESTKPVFYDGDCPIESADQQAREIAQQLGYECRQLPPRKRNAAEFLARNRRIVEHSGVLVAAPETDHEKIRSGTWMTVRYARKCAKPVVMLAR
jgi:hypothetical protein